MKKKKILIIASLLTTFINLGMWFYLGVPAFASMGSTGGGVSTGGDYTGSSYSGSGLDFSDSSSSGNFGKDLKGAAQGILNFLLYVLIILIIIGLYKLTKKKLKDWYITRTYNSDLFHRKDFIKMIKLLDQPPERAFFDEVFRAFKKLGLLQNVEEDGADQIDLQGLKETYIQAQYLYSQLIRQRLVDKHADLSPLKQYLDPYFFYRTMVKEIKLKSSNGEVDDTVVDKVEILQLAQFGDLYFTRIRAVGQDKEIQFNEDYNSSFARTAWSDYVIFGKDRQGKIKIITLMYGEHAHLNGKNFNNDSNLNQIDDLDENNNHDSDYYRKLNQGKQKRHED